MKGSDVTGDRGPVPISPACLDLVPAKLPSGLRYLPPVHRCFLEQNLPMSCSTLTIFFVDDELPSLDEASTSVDALVSDDPIDATIRHPPGVFDAISRPVTPARPPGFGNDSTSPAVVHPAVLPSRTQQAPPAVPLKPTVGPGQSKKPTVAEAKKNVKALALDSGLSKEISKSRSQKVLQEEDFPALNTAKASASHPAVSGNSKSATTKAGATPGKKAAEKAAESVSELATSDAISGGQASKSESRAGEKRPSLGALNTTMATKTARKSIDGPSSEKPLPEKDAAFPALPSLPMTQMSSPSARTAPKTLRVVPTPKTEVPPTPTAMAAIPFNLARSAAAASVRPETPASEIISDSASIASASISLSRTSSPPPQKVGTAPVRTTTKSQLRKQRKEASKKDTAAIAEQPPKLVEAEVQIGPIVGRKKKQKKAKTASSEDNSPVLMQPVNQPESRAETPVPQPPSQPQASLNTASAKEMKDGRDEKGLKDETSTYRAIANESTSLVDDKFSRKKPVETQTKPAGNAVPSRVEAEPTPTSRLQPTPASIFAQLVADGILPSEDVLAFLKPVTNQSDKYRPEGASLPGSPPTRSLVTEEDLAALLAGKPIRKEYDGVRILLTPNGDCVRNLSPEEEDRFLELQKRIAETAGSPASFVLPKHESSTHGFRLVNGRAVQNGPPGCFPQPPGAYPMDPLNKIQREEAIYYINQWILPRLSLGTSSPGASNLWKAAFPDGRVNIAATTASLTTIAPWIYGSTASAYDSVVAPEVNYPGPVGSFVDSPDHQLETTSTDRAPLAPETSDIARRDQPATQPVAAPGSIPILEVDEAEKALAIARKETEKLEKSLNQMIKKNRRLLTLTHSH